VYWLLGVPYNSGLTNAQEIESLVCVSLAVICWSWIGGFVRGTLSGHAICINGSLFYLNRCFLCGPFGILLYSLRFILTLYSPFLWAGAAHITVFQAGIRQSQRHWRLGISQTLRLAAVVTTLIVLVTRIGGWQQAALAKCGLGKWNPGGPPWQQPLAPLLVVSGPIVYLLATALAEQRSSKRTMN
jgi:hypothetical protein